MSHNQAKATLMNLPSEIILEILSRLPIRTIMRCKCVCSELLELITNAGFAELHLPRSTPGLIIQRSSDYLCKVLEFEDEVEVQNNDHLKQLMEFQPRDIITNPGGGILVTGSVNGLLCFVENVYLDNLYIYNFYICNPITREYIALPKPEEFLLPLMVTVCGFGVSSSSGEYKLVRISHDFLDSPSGSVPDLKCLIYTLGTGSWRSITAGITFKLKCFSPNVFLSGSLHWLVGDAEGYSFIACFDLETELFNSFPRIPFPLRFQGYGSLGILGDCLFVCDYSPDKEIVIWAMKDYGVGESWTKEYVINMEVGDLYWMVYEGVRPLKFFKDGVTLFVSEAYGVFCYSTETETALDVHLFEWTEDGLIAGMLHASSLLSLKRFDKENVASLGY